MKTRNLCGYPLLESEEEETDIENSLLFKEIPDKNMGVIFLEKLHYTKVSANAYRIIWGNQKKSHIRNILINRMKQTTYVRSLIKIKPIVSIEK